MALAKCAHPGCSCLPADHVQYCGDHCAKAAAHEAKQEIGCLCGHTGCDPKGAHHDTPFETGEFTDNLLEPRH